MKKMLLSLLVSGAFLVSSCASIVSKSVYPVNIHSQPEGATYELLNNYQVVIASGRTPSVVSLDASDGFFCKGRYLIRMSMPGYAPTVYSLHASMDGWYIGNILFGGLIGFLLVDPATGAMWKLPPSVNVSLAAEASPVDAGAQK